MSREILLLVDALARAGKPQAASQVQMPVSAARLWEMLSA